MNVNWLSSLPGLTRKAIYFGLQTAIGSRIVPIWRDFQSWERLSKAELDPRIDQKLLGLLNHATTHSPYYRNLKLSPRQGESPQNFLRRFPVLTRELLRSDFLELVVDACRGEITSTSSVSRKRYDWLVVKTGGTTGNPTTVVHDATGRDWGRASRLFSARACGHPFGTRYFRLWGSEPDLYKIEASLPLRTQRNLLGEVLLNAFKAKEPELRQHLETIRRHPRIKSMMAYVDAAASLAMFIEDHKLKAPRLDTIMACAGTVTPEWRSILQDTFQAEVFDKYGSRECCDIACECKQHRGLHVYSPTVFIEILDDNNQPCPPGATGRILVTMLNNLAFPIIRYQIGDLGQWADPKPCPCGLAWPRIESLQGRQDDMLTTEDGTLLSSVFVRHFLGVSLNRQLIREWQLEQTGRKEFVFRYIPVKNEGLAENLYRIRESFHLALGKTVTIEQKQVTEIPLSPTGKVRWIINSTRSK